MSRCSHYQSQALDHLYGLLDADESLTLIEHVGQCEDCRAALLKADLHKKLLSAASKPEFAGIRFDVLGSIRSSSFAKTLILTASNDCPPPVERIPDFGP
jgi:predicted anti-sigma-YlaC factor YlaD